MKHNPFAPGVAVKNDSSAALSSGLLGLRANWHYLLAQTAQSDALIYGSFRNADTGTRVTSFPDLTSKRAGTFVHDPFVVAVTAQGGALVACAGFGRLKGRISLIVTRSAPDNRKDTEFRTIVGARGWEHPEWTGCYYPDDLPPSGVFRSTPMTSRASSCLRPRGAPPARVAQWRDDVPGLPVPSGAERSTARPPAVRRGAGRGVRRLGRGARTGRPALAARTTDALDGSVPT